VDAPGGPVNRLTVYGDLPSEFVQDGDAGVALRRIAPFGAFVLSPARSGKHVGLSRHLREVHHAGLTANIAFGDDDSDAPLLAGSAAGVAVPSSSPAARRSAMLHLSVPLGDFLASRNPRDVILTTGA
jgi:hypothetical protein